MAEPSISCMGPLSPRMREALLRGYIDHQGTGRALLNRGLCTGWDWREGGQLWLTPFGRDVRELLAGYNLWQHHRRQLDEQRRQPQADL